MSSVRPKADVATLTWSEPTGDARGGQSEFTSLSSSTPLDFAVAGTWSHDKNRATQFAVVGGWVTKKRSSSRVERIAKDTSARDKSIGAPLALIGPATDVYILARGTPSWSIFDKANELRIRGELPSSAFEETRALLADAFALESREKLNRLIRLVEGLNGKVDAVFPLAGAIACRIGGAAAEVLYQSPEVARIGQPSSTMKSFHAPDNKWFGIAAQTMTYAESGIFGSSSTVGVIDQGFDDTLGNLLTAGVSRIGPKFVVLNLNQVVPVLGPWPAQLGGIQAEHGSVVSHIVAGDFMNQDPALEYSYFALQRFIPGRAPSGPLPPAVFWRASGVASQCRLVWVHVDSGRLLPGAVAVFAALPVSVVLLTTLNADGVDDRRVRGMDSCRGDDMVSHFLNAAARATGTLPLVAAGEHGRGPNQRNRCQLLDPAAASYAFTVNGFGDINLCSKPIAARLPDDQLDIVQALRTRHDTTPPLGGVVGGSDHRRISRALVSLAAPIRREYAIEPADLNPPRLIGCAYSPRMGRANRGLDVMSTSIATSYVAGGAALLRDWAHTRNYPNWWYEDGGVLHAILLLMGDRGLRQSGKDLLSPGFVRDAASGVSDELGAGRFLMRQFDSRGLGAPYVFAAGWALVRQGISVRLCVAANPIRPMVDLAFAADSNRFPGVGPRNECPPLPVADGNGHLKAVIWWPEPTIIEEDGTLPASIHLHLRVLNSPIANEIGSSIVSDLSSDTTKLVYASRGLEGRSIAVEIAPNLVQSNVWENGEAVRRVFFAFFYEDRSRAVRFPPINNGRVDNRFAPPRPIYLY